MKSKNLKNEEKWREEASKMQEYELFFSIEALASMQWIEKHEYNHGRLKISLEDLSNNQKSSLAIQLICLNMLEKFGVDLKSVYRKDGDCWKWYSFWKFWLLNLSDTELQQVSEKLKKKESIESFLPSKKWND